MKVKSLWWIPRHSERDEGRCYRRYALGSGSKHWSNDSRM